MTVKELYDRLNLRIPEHLREEWDNDGIMCCPDFSSEVRCALITLDVTEEIVDYAISRGFDLIISHHPLVFKPIGRLTEASATERKLIKLVSNNISVFSFHTRLDKVDGGVNDVLAGRIGLTSTRSFGEGGLGRIGVFSEETSLDMFCEFIKMQLGADSVRYADAYNPVRRVALVGGDGKGFIEDAIREGADTYISGRIGYNVMETAAELGINLIEAGHYFTENPVCEMLSSLVSSIDPSVEIEVADSNMIKLI